MAEAEIYHCTSDLQLEDGLKLLKKLPIQETDVVLDLGCGTGRLTSNIAKRVINGKVIGIDPDEERIKIAMAESTGDSTSLQFMIASDQSFPENQYDHVVSTDVIHWIKDKEAAFTRVYNNLKPGGKFGFTTAHGSIINSLMMEIFQLCEVADNMIALEHCELGDYYKELAIKTGFVVDFLEITERSSQYKSINSFIDFFYAVYQGKFDKNHPALDDLKKKYEGKVVKHVGKRLTVVLTKPN
ncbi:PREDICTED: uncharacterized protein LOC105312430 [Amphimedon queenslandica]|nr:PREDICTED: uncharacterized protein LOC105312430 [Amphimedon queenslandica]|eukprot:XP_011403367.1 PREDICTED: uncharacterized protein LOC105312430 [Amphimedon queenslandica]